MLGESWSSCHSSAACLKGSSLLWRYLEDGVMPQDARLIASEI